MDPKERQNRTRAEPPALLADCCGYAKPCAAPPRQAMRRPTQDAYASHPGPLQRFWKPGARPQIGGPFNKYRNNYYIRKIYMTILAIPLYYLLLTTRVASIVRSPREP